MRLSAAAPQQPGGGRAAGAGGAAGADGTGHILGEPGLREAIGR